MYLRPDASNLAALLYRLQQTASTQYEMIRDTIRMIAPFFDDFILRPMPENENKIRLEWREQGSDYPFLRITSRTVHSGLCVWPHYYCNRGCPPLF